MNEIPLVNDSRENPRNLMTRLSHVRLLAEYNRWMNAKLYASAMGLPAEVLNADRGAFFKSIIGTLNHLAVADTIWLQRYTTGHPREFQALAPLRALPTPQSLDEILFDDIQQLAERRTLIDQCILDWSAELQEEDLDQVLQYSNMKGVPARRAFFSVVLHLFNHQTHHRGQTTTLLSQAGVDVGVTDLLVLIPDLPQA